MKQKRTARELLAQIENDYFRGAGLAEASMTLSFEDVKHYQRIIYVLQQTERIMQR